MAALRNPKHEAFCRDVAGGSSFDAAWVASGNSEKARNVGRLVKQPKIQARIAELQREFNEAAGIKMRWLQEKLIPLATSDVTRYFESDATGKLSLRDVTQLPSELRGALSELKIDADGQVTVKTHSKLAAIDTLIKMSGGFAPERIELSGSVSTPASDQDAAPLDRMRRVMYLTQTALISFADDPFVHNRMMEDLRMLVESTARGEILQEAFADHAAHLAPDEFVLASAKAIARCAKKVVDDADADAARAFVKWLRNVASAVERDALQRPALGVAQGGVST
jgi:hypothetical protein